MDFGTREPLRIADDERARKILLNAYWAGGRWRPSVSVDEEDRSYAEEAGYFLAPRSADHEGWVRMATAARDRISVEDVIGAFVGSLSTRRLPQRSALASLAELRHFDVHPYVDWSHACLTCGVPERHTADRSRLNFMRHKWGAVGRVFAETASATVDLELFRRSEWRAETTRDSVILRQILGVAGEMPARSGASDLERAIGSLFASNEAERRAVIETLALCGVLADPEHPAPWTSWVARVDREPPAVPWKVDWAYPTFWWRGAHGVNEAAAKAIFGERVQLS